MLAALVALAACDNNDRKSIAECRLRAHAIYPGKDTRDDSVWAFMFSCMEAAGYQYRGAFGMCIQRHMITDRSCWQTPTEMWIDLIKRRLFG